MTRPEGESAPAPDEHDERRRSDRRSSGDRRVKDVGPPDGNERRNDERRKGDRRRS